MDDTLDNRLTELESRLAFQELALTELSDAMAVMRNEQTRSRELTERALKDLEQLRLLLYADPGSEVPPPHY
jgi:SlyX protein